MLRIAILAGAAIGLGTVQAVAMAAEPQADLAGVYQSSRVANFVEGGRGDAAHPAARLRFWSGPKGQVIEYDAGDHAETIMLRPAGLPGGRDGLQVTTPDGSTWVVTLSAGALLLDDKSPAGVRTFVWEYQGPVNGRGTACGPCVPEDKALQFVRDAFVNAQR